MENRRKTDVFFTAAGGVVTALTFALCAVGGLVPFTKIIVPALCGMLLIVIMRYVSLSVAVMSCIASSALMLLFLPDKMTAVIYASVFGYYPMLFIGLEKVSSGILKTAVKVLLFAAVGAAALYVGIHFMALKENELFIKYRWVIGIMYALLVMSYDMFIRHTVRVMESEWDERLKGFFRGFMQKRDKRRM